MLEDFLSFYPKWVLATAIALFVIHLIMPYHPLEKVDPLPPKYFGPFSLGELVQFLIQTLTLPLILFFAFLLDLPTVLGPVLLGIWWFAPRALARRIDR